MSRQWHGGLEGVNVAEAETLSMCARQLQHMASASPPPRMAPPLATRSRFSSEAQALLNLDTNVSIKRFRRAVREEQKEPKGLALVSNSERSSAFWWLQRGKPFFDIHLVGPLVS